MFDDIWAYIGTLLWGWFAVMGGALATLLAFYERVIKKEDLHLKRYVFVFVFVAGFFAWREEKEKRDTLQKELNEKTKPQLVGSIQEYTHGEVNGETNFIVFVRVVNSGAPSVVNDIKLLVGVGDKVIEAKTVPVSQSTIVHLGMGDKRLAMQAIPLEGQAMTTPIATGGQIYGYMAFTLERVSFDTFEKEGKSVAISFADYTGRRYSTPPRWPLNRP